MSAQYSQNGIVIASAHSQLLVPSFLSRYKPKISGSLALQECSVREYGSGLRRARRAQGREEEGVQGHGDS